MFECRDESGESAKEAEAVLSLARVDTKRNKDVGSFLPCVSGFEGDSFFLGESTGEKSLGVWFRLLTLVACTFKVASISLLIMVLLYDGAALTPLFVDSSHASGS